MAETAKPAPPDLGLDPPLPGLPEGRRVRLPNRGTTWVRELPGPGGNAPTVLLLHGWTATADLNWGTSYRALGARYRVLAIDHRGHGRGIRSVWPFRLEDAAADAAALVRALDAGPVIAVGYSMGGPIAQLLWRRHRPVVSGLVLCATAGRFVRAGARNQLMSGTLHGVALAARMTPAAVRAQLVRRYASSKVDDDPRLAWAARQVSLHDPAALLQAGSALAGFDSAPWLGEVDVPTAVVVTSADTLVSPARQAALARSIPDARVFPVDASHAAPIDAAGRFVPALVAAIDDVAGRARRPPPQRGS